MHRALALGLSLLLSGCYLSFEREGPAAPFDAGRPMVERDAGPTLPCATPRLETVRFEFARRPPGCPWGEGDNLAPRDDFASARVEESIPFMPSELGALCTLRFDFSPDGEPVEIVYDDNFFLLIGDIVVAASDRELVERLPEDGNVVLWDWSAIRGQFMDVDAPTPYCLGEREGISTCELPSTEERGRIRLDLPLERFPALLERLRSGEPVEVTFITVGDNDLDRDCAHGAFSFEIQASLAG